MLEDLTQRVDTVQRDTVIVFHQIGSHGPAYAERYPPQFEIFKPVCRSSELQRCTVEEVRNAYDNSIAYSDFVLSRQIEILRKAADRFDTMLIYASDHGESLGERGVYLHGMPYAFAPEDQKRVPMLMWTSPAFRSRMIEYLGALRLSPLTTIVARTIQPPVPVRALWMGVATKSPRCRWYSSVLRMEVVKSVRGSQSRAVLTASMAGTRAWMSW